MDYLEENRALGRHVFPDLVRAFALFGIVLVNVAYFAFPGEITYFYGGLDGPADELAAFAVDALFPFKSYTLFSVMFGVGLALQMGSAERRGEAFGPRYLRRTLGLALLGALHVTLAFVGDILIVYALLGAVLFAFRGLSTAALVRWGAAFLCLQLLVSVLFAAAVTMGETFDSAGMAESSRRMGVRSGALLDPGAGVWTRARRAFLPAGLLVGLVGARWIHVAADPLSGAGPWGTALILLGAPLSSFGYLGALAKWADGPMTPAKRFLARAGTASLSAYLLQSLILSFVFCGYGLGLFGRIGAAGCVAIAALTGLVSLAASSLWRARFARGPFEALLRRWTYLGAGR